MSAPVWKVATWNVNSLRVRLPHLSDWLAATQVDVALLQETKSTDENFPAEALREAGYYSAHYGQKTYNGVAILSKTPLSDVQRGMPQIAEADGTPQARLIAATTAGVRAVSVYVPNGQSVESDKYHYKLKWLDNYADYLQSLSGQAVVAGGDYNIAPRPEDIYDAEAWGDGILASPRERAAYQTLLSAGYEDAHCLFPPEEDNTFSWWDYRQAAFRRNMGLRIDLMLLSATMRPRCISCRPDKTPRSWERPSDHTPVVAEFRGIGV